MSRRLTLACAGNFSVSFSNSNPAVPSHESRTQARCCLGLFRDLSRHTHVSRTLEHRNHCSTLVTVLHYLFVAGTVYSAYGKFIGTSTSSCRRVNGTKRSRLHAISRRNWGGQKQTAARIANWAWQCRMNTSSRKCGCVSNSVIYSLEPMRLGSRS